MECFDQNDYPHQWRQKFLMEWYKTGIHQNNWYVVGIHEQKRLLAVYNAVKMDFGIHLVRKSNWKIFHQKLWYTRWYKHNLVYISCMKKAIESCIATFFCCENNFHCGKQEQVHALFLQAKTKGWRDWAADLQWQQWWWIWMDNKLCPEYSSSLHFGVLPQAPLERTKSWMEWDSWWNARITNNNSNDS